MTTNPNFVLQPKNQIQQVPNLQTSVNEVPQEYYPWALADVVPTWPFFTRSSSYVGLTWRLRRTLIQEKVKPVGPTYQLHKK